MTGPAPLVLTTQRANQEASNVATRLTELDATNTALVARAALCDRALSIKLLQIMKQITSSEKTALVSRVENLRIFSCSSGSLSAITPALPNRHQEENRL